MIDKDIHFARIVRSPFEGDFDPLRAEFSVADLRYGFRPLHQTVDYADIAREMTQPFAVHVNEARAKGGKDKQFEVCSLIISHDELYRNLTSVKRSGPGEVIMPEELSKAMTALDAACAEVALYHRDLHDFPSQGVMVMSGDEVFEACRDRDDGKPKFIKSMFLKTTETYGQLFEIKSRTEGRSKPLRHQLDFMPRAG